MTQITVRLPDDLKDRVAGMARAADRTLSRQVVYLLRRGIEAERADAAKTVDRVERLVEGARS